MTIPELIEDVLRRIRSTDRYHGRDREFLRDRSALMKAIARYGYECEQRGWDVKPDAILSDLVGLLRDIVNKGADIKYFPVYLEGAVDRHLRTRAEEMNLAAKAARAVPRLVQKTVAATDVVRVIEKTPVEILATLYTDLKKRRKAAHAKRPSKTTQEDLL
jgi:hypothetical protein